MEGKALYWDAPDVTYWLNDKGFPGLADSTTRRLFAESFAAWEAVKCGTSPLGFAFTAAAGTTAEGAQYTPGAPNKNVLVHHTSAEWLALPQHSAQAFALTTVAYHPKTGRIFGADIEFNGGMPPFGECPADGCGASSAITDLRNVATHEIGHVLGLAHSDKSLATMSCDARPGDTDKRSLGTDDVTGICTAYPPGESFPEDYVDTAKAAGSVGGCSISHVPAKSDRGAFWLALSALGWCCSRTAPRVSTFLPARSRVALRRFARKLRRAG